MRTTGSGGGGFGGTSGAASRDAFETLADWVAALHGGGQFRAALERLTRLLGADAGIVIRHVECTGRHRQIAVVAPTEVQLPVQRRRSVARDALGEGLASLRAGAVWVLSETLRESTFLEEQWLSEQLQALEIRDVAAVILGTKGGQVDYCELHFRHTTTRQSRTQLDDLAPVLTRAWGGRVPGTVERLIARRRAQEDRAGQRHHDLLSAGNPAELSRSEFRICALVREGLLARAIAGELGVTESTVRSHLHSIYAKTGAAGHVDLLHRLSRPAQDADDAPTRLAS